jgi:hypothetical protein
LSPEPIRKANSSPRHLPQLYASTMPIFT